MVSAMTGDGMDALRGILRERLALSDATPRFLARRRHLDALQRCSAALALASAQLATTPRFELAAEELRLAQSHLGEIVGDLTSDELLGHIFGSFCIGK
jgi:tRNA modification GTPase